MTFGQSLLLAAVTVASFVALSGIVSAMMVLLWKTCRAYWAELPSRARAGRLAALRFLPTAVVAVVTVGFILPLFLAEEPLNETEEVGPALIAAGILGLAIIARSLFAAVRTIISTARVRRNWLRGATPLEAGRGSGVPSVMVETDEPVVALVGLWQPVLVVASRVVAACRPDELDLIVRHERAHFVARDNLKRLLMMCLPDAMTLTGYHSKLGRAWHEAAEDAADDAATLGEPMARLDLAALLLKVAALAPRPREASSLTSPFLDPEGLERRVRRLTRDDPAPRPTPSDHLAGALLIAISLVLSTLLFSPTARDIVHSTLEAIVAAGVDGR